MVRIEWSEELFGCGDETIDRQHQELFDHLNRLWEACTSDQWQSEEARELFQFLDRYLVEHFTDEERLMETVRCPSRERNRVEHEQFIRVFRLYRGRFEAEGPSEELLHEMRRILYDWFSSHIQEVDTLLRGLKPVQEAGDPSGLM